MRACELDQYALAEHWKLSIDAPFHTDRANSALEALIASQSARYDIPSVQVTTDVWWFGWAIAEEIPIGTQMASAREHASARQCIQAAERLHANHARHCTTSLLFDGVSYKGIRWLALTMQHLLSLR